MNTAKLAVGLITLSLIAACGGGGSAGPAAGDGASSTSTTSGGGSTGAGGGGGGGIGATSGSVSSLSGKVIDGPIEGATVCLDINSSRTCDSGERTAVTARDGSYSLDISGLDNMLVAGGMLLVTIPETAKDADDNGKTMKEAGKPATIMMAPVYITMPAANIINPFTTLIAQMMLDESNTEPVATDWVRSQLGLSTDAVLNVDFSETTTDPKIKSLFVLGRNLFKNQVGLTQWCIKTAEYRVEELSTQLPKIYMQCAQLALGFMRESMKNPRQPMDDFMRAMEPLLDNGLQQLFSGKTFNSIRDFKKTAESNLAVDIFQGLNEVTDQFMTDACWNDSRHPDCNASGYYELKTITRSNDGRLTERQRYASRPNANFFLNAAPAPKYWQLMNNNWDSIPSDVNAQSLGDGQYKLTGAEYGSTGLNMIAYGYELKNIELMNRKDPKGPMPRLRFSVATTFPDNAIGYTVFHESTQPRYILSGEALTGPLQEVLTANLNSLINAYPSSANPSFVNSLQLNSSLRITFSPTGPTGGTLNFRNPDIPNQVLSGIGSYTLESVGDKTLLKISEIPDQVLTAIRRVDKDKKGFMHYADGVRPFFAVSPDGNIREGIYSPAMKVSKPKLMVNRTALNAALKALSLCQMNANYENMACPN